MSRIKTRPEKPDNAIFWKKFKALSFHDPDIAPHLARLLRLFRRSPSEKA